MSAGGTLLSDLDQKGSPGDDDLVRQIFKDLNNPSPSFSGGNEVINAPNPNTVAPHTMDNQPATSHVIGRDHPSPADFAAAMHGVQRAPIPQNGPPPPSGNYNMGSQWMEQQGLQQQQQQQMPMMPLGKNVYSRVADEIKTPILVTLLFFVFSMPFINILFSHYIPSLIKPTGDLTTVGVLVKAALAGATFWVLQRVVAPLLAI
jgi:hypothetical protein